MNRNSISQGRTTVHMGVQSSVCPWHVRAMPLRHSHGSLPFTEMLHDDSFIIVLTVARSSHH